MSVRRTKIFIDNKYVAVTVKGTGAPVILLHGYLSKKESFYYQIEAFSKAGRRVIAPDFPAFGASAPIDFPWSVGDYADWLDKFIKINGLAGADVLAHSFGARVVFKLLSRYSESDGLVNRLIITGGAGLVKPRSPQYMRRVRRYRRVKKFFPKLAEKKFGSEEYRSLSPLMRESYKLIVNEDLRECAGRISCPTLLIYGNKDSVTPPSEEGEIFRSAIKGSRLEVMEGTHFCFSENPQVFNALALNFLQDGQNIRQ